MGFFLLFYDSRVAPLRRLPRAAPQPRSLATGGGTAASGPAPFCRCRRGAPWRRSGLPAHSSRAPFPGLKKAKIEAYPNPAAAVRQVASQRKGKRGGERRDGRHLQDGGQKRQLPAAGRPPGPGIRWSQQWHCFPGVEGVSFRPFLCLRVFSSNKPQRQWCCEKPNWKKNNTNLKTNPDGPSQAFPEDKKPTGRFQPGGFLP